MIGIPGQQKYFQNPTPINGDTIRILRRVCRVQACKVGDELRVIRSKKRDGIVYATCIIEGNKHPSVLSSSYYEWEIVNDKFDYIGELKRINEKLDYIIEFINKIRN